MMLPAPPPGGGYLVLNKRQLANAELMTMIKAAYPATRIIEQRPIPLR